MLTVSLRRPPGEAGEDAAVLESSHPAACAAAADPVALAVELLGGPWKPLVAWQLFWGPRRFGELVRRTPGVRPRRLRRTLAELERDGLVRKRLRPRPARPTEYALTPLGESAKPLLATLYEWGLGLRGRRDCPVRTQPEPPLDGPWPRADPHEKENS
jgi:DNA-binding HxlR family transcriptional regulator